MVLNSYLHVFVLNYTQVRNNKKGITQYHCNQQRTSVICSIIEITTFLGEYFDIYIVILAIMNKIYCARLTEENVTSPFSNVLHSRTM